MLAPVSVVVVSDGVPGLTPGMEAKVPADRYRAIDHGGEAVGSRERFKSLGEEEQAAVIEFLKSL